MRPAVPAILLAAGLGLAALLGRAGPPAEFTLIQSDDAFTLDPQRMNWQQDIRLGRAIFETLVVAGKGSGEVRPGAAESWEPSADGRTWTFRLRRDARWSNGDPVVAADFVDAWLRGMVPDLASDYAGFFEEVEGARDLWSFRESQLRAFAALPSPGRTSARAQELWDGAMAFAASRVGLRARDDRTFEVTLRARVPYWLSIVAFPVMSPIHRPTVDRFCGFDLETGRRTVDARWTRPGTLVCNGPYVVKDWMFRRRMRLARNPFHWDRAPGPPETIDILPIEDPNTAVLAYESGAADWVADVRAPYKPELVAQAARFAGRHRAELDRLLAAGEGTDEALASLPAPAAGERRDAHVVPNFGTDFFSFNCRQSLPGGRTNPLADSAVRRALTLATDRRALAERVVRYGEPPATTLVPPGAVRGYRSPAGLPHDPERARGELASAGWIDRDSDGVPESADGRAFPPVEILYSTGNPRYRDLSLALRDMWRRELGIPVEMRSMDSKAMKERLRSGDFMVARGGWYGDYDDPTTFLELCRSTDGNNDRGYACPEFDSALDRAATEPDPAVRLGILSGAERIIAERDVPLLTVTHYATVLLFDPVRVRGITRDPSFDQVLSDVRVIRRR